jgi:hypothetical protein
VTAATLGRVAATAERVRVESARIDLGMLVLSVLMALPFAVCWLLRALWTVAAVMVAAGAEGWRSGPGAPRREDPSG